MYFHLQMLHKCLWVNKKRKNKNERLKERDVEVLIDWNHLNLECDPEFEFDRIYNGPPAWTLDK